MLPSVHAFVVFLVVVDPIGLTAIYLGLTEGAGAAYRKRMATRGVVLAGVILILFALGGPWLLHALGITLPAFRIAGGLLLFLLAIDMVFARHSGLRAPTGGETDEARARADISVFPLAFPLIAGPGALTSVLLLADTDAGHPWAFAAALGLLILVLVICYVLLRTADAVMGVLGLTGVNVVDRLFGVLLAALAVQYVVDGVVALRLFARA
jgi:multiple antibiotic resistance protein